MTRTVLVLSVFVVLSACGSESAAPATPAVAPAPEAPPAPPAPRYSVHEWGLIGVDATTSDTGTIATVVSHPPPGLGPEGSDGTSNRIEALGRYGTGISAEIPVNDPRRGRGPQGGKPVIYLHVPDGAPPVDVSVRVRLPVDGLLEHWPPGESSNGALTWNVTARSGACTSPLAPPAGDSEACSSVRDAFCEAAEIPRYYGANDSCVRVGDAEAELLFYRGEGMDASRLPLALGQVDGAWQVARRNRTALEGPVMLVELVDGAPRLRVLTAPDYRVPAETDPVITPGQARALLRDEAIRRGLAPEEADAFLDAWSPAYFGPCLRTGPVAQGRPPVSLAEAGRALLYFAPEPLVDTLLPLELTPAPEARHRVFLVRFVDPASRVELPATP